MNDTLTMPNNTTEQVEQPNSSPETEHSLVLPAFDRDVPPLVHQLPPYMTSAQIGVVLGVTSDSARTSGGRGKFGTVMVKDKQRLFSAEGVVRFWGEKYGPKVLEPATEQVERPYSLASDTDRLLSVLEQIAGRDGSKDDTIQTLVQLTSSLSGEITQLRAELAESKKQGGAGANTATRTRRWWMFGNA